MSLIECQWEQLPNNIPSSLKDKNGNYALGIIDGDIINTWKLIPISDLKIIYQIDDQCKESGIIVHSSNIFKKDTYIRIANVYGGLVIIDRNNIIHKSNLTCINGYKTFIRLGNNNLIWGMAAIVADLMGLIIGNNCLFGDGLVIRAGQTHSIIDITSGEFVNPIERIVTIGNHVWTALQVHISGRGSITENCIVGAKSFVNNVFNEQHCLIAGIPAKVIKKNVIWNKMTPITIITEVYCKSHGIPFDWKYAKKALNEYNNNKENYLDNINFDI